MAADAPVDSAPDAAATDVNSQCDLGATWGAPTQVVFFDAANGFAALSEDELTILFDGLVETPVRRYAIFVARRASLAEAFKTGSEIASPVRNVNHTTYQPALDV